MSEMSNIEGQRFLSAAALHEAAVEGWRIQESESELFGVQTQIVDEQGNNISLPLFEESEEEQEDG